MVGRQVIQTVKPFTLEELEAFMQQYWDRNHYNDFLIGKPTPASAEEYILLPATARFMVIAYARKSGLLNKTPRVILAVCDTPAGIGDRLMSSIPTESLLFGCWQISRGMSAEKERKGPAEEALKKYADYMRRLLAEAGHTA